MALLAEVRPRALVILLRQNNLNIRLATPHPLDRALSLQFLDTAILREVNLLTKAQVCQDILQDTDLVLEGAAVNITPASGTGLDSGQRLATIRGHSRMEASPCQRSNLDNNRGKDTGSNSSNNINNKNCNSNNSSSSSNNKEPCLVIPRAMGGPALPPPSPHPILVLDNKCQANILHPLPRSISPSPCRGQYSTFHLRRTPGQRSFHLRWVPSLILRCHSMSRCCPRPPVTLRLGRPRPPTPPRGRCRPSPCPRTPSPVSRHSSRLSPSLRSGITPRSLSTQDIRHRWIRTR